MLSKLFGILGTTQKIHDLQKTLSVHKFSYLFYYKKMNCVIGLLTEYLIRN